MQFAEWMGRCRAPFLSAAVFSLLVFAGAQPAYAQGCSSPPKLKTGPLCEDVTCICGIAGNDCTTPGEVKINVPTRVGCKSFDFSGEGRGKVEINALVEAKRSQNCIVEFVLDELTVGPTGIWRACSPSNTHGRTKQVVTGPGGEAMRIVVESGGQILVITRPEKPKPVGEIDLRATEVEIAGTVLAAARGTEGAAPHISIRSTSDGGYVLITGTAQVAAGAQDPGGAFIDIFACFIELDGGLVDASVKKTRNRRNAVVMIARETIWIHNGGTIDARVRHAEAGAHKGGGIVILVAGNGTPPTDRNRNPIPAALIVDGEINADVIGGHGLTVGGAIRMLAALEKVLIGPFGNIHANSLNNGNRGGSVVAAADDTVTNNGNVDSRGGGAGGSVLFKSFNNDVDGIPADPVDVDPGGACLVESCVFPPTSNFGCAQAADCTSCDAAFDLSDMPLEVIEVVDRPGNVCSLEPCVGGCACVFRFVPRRVQAAALPVQVTLQGLSMTAVSEVRLNDIAADDCSPTAGTVLACDPPNPGEITCAVPGGTAAGDYQFVVVTPAGSFCTTDTVPFTVTP